VEAIFVVGALVIGSVILTLVIVVFSDDTAAPKRAGYRRVTLVIGFAIVAAGVSILFFDVGAWDTYSFEPGGNSMWTAARLGMQCSRRTTTSPTLHAPSLPMPAFGSQVASPR